VETVTDRLQAAARGAAPPLSLEAKVAEWEELKLLAFTRALSSAWAVALLSVFLRVQLNLLGSHAFLGVALGRPAAAGAHTLSLRAQHVYLALHNHFLRAGCGELAAGVRAGCLARLATVPLDSPVGHAQLCALLADVQATALVSLDLEALFLPPASSDGELLLRAREASPVGSSPEAEDAADARLLPALMLETRRALRGERCAAVARLAAAEATRELCEALRAGLEAAEGQVLPLAKIVPAVSAASNAALAPPAREGVAAAVAKLPALDAFAADLFSAVE